MKIEGLLHAGYVFECSRQMSLVILKITIDENENIISHSVTIGHTITNKEIKTHNEVIETLSNKIKDQLLIKTKLPYLHVFKKGDILHLKDVDNLPQIISKDYILEIININESTYKVKVKDGHKKYINKEFNIPFERLHYSKIEFLDKQDSRFYRYNTANRQVKYRLVSCLPHKVNNKLFTLEDLKNIKIYEWEDTNTKNKVY